MKDLSNPTNKDMGEQLVSGLKQLDMNLKLLYKAHHLRDLDLAHPYTVNTANALKLAYVNEALKGLSPTDVKV